MSASVRQVPTAAKLKVWRRQSLRLLVLFVVAFGIVCAFRPSGTALVFWGLGLASAYLLAVFYFRQILDSSLVTVPATQDRMRLVADIRHGRMETDERLRAVQVAEAQRWARNGYAGPSAMAIVVAVEWLLVVWFAGYGMSLAFVLVVLTAGALSALTVNSFVNIRGARKILRDA